MTYCDESSVNAPRSFDRPELLAPAGDRECIRAAVENGADAVYFGLRHGFNARARATNFELSELTELMANLRQRGVRGYVTLNTLAFTDELPTLQATVEQIARAGVSAVLVQDLGLARLIRHICPELPIHASTQMTMTSAENIQVIRRLGIERVVLARELSLTEIKKIRQQTDMPLEVFVHGALCVAYSGQCLTSESLGGRSANRGQCAQACRMTYDLVCDGRDIDLGAMKYLLSPQDLAAYALIPSLVELGVCAFKIEGRLKTPEYVANITRHYRQAIDAALNQRDFHFADDEIRDMELSFSRGFSPGWLQGCDHKMLVPGLSSAKRGVLLGEVQSIQGNQVQVRLRAPLAAGDGVVFEGDREQNAELGGRVFSVLSKGRAIHEPVERGTVGLTFGHRGLDVKQLQAGQKIWKTDDPRLTARLRKSFSSPDPIRKVGLDLRIEAIAGQPLRVWARAESGASCEVVSLAPLATATKHPATDELFRTQFGRLGGTAYELRLLYSDTQGSPMVPLSVLGQLRRDMIRALDASITVPPVRQIRREALSELRRQIPQTHPPEVEIPQLNVLCRSLAQLDAVLESAITNVYVDFQDIREYNKAVAAAHSFGANILLATPRIEKPGERGIFVALNKAGADGILARNLAGLEFFAERRVCSIADFSLNATNELTVQFLRELGAERVTASYDLNRDQLLEMVSKVPAEWLEVVVHQHMPMFHMEHCVFCAVLSPGTNKTNCGRPCDHHQVKLRDHIGMEHTLHADVGCRNTLFNAVPQSAAEVVPTLIHQGIRQFRVELLDESPAEIRKCLAIYSELLRGQVTGKDVWTQLRAMNRVGVTRGTLEERRNPLAIL